MKPDAFRLATRLALTELMLSGCTCASDHQYLFPVGLDDAMDIQAEEAARVGIRMTLNRGSMNLSEKDGGLPPDSVVQDEDTILADCERVLSRYHDAERGRDAAGGAGAVRAVHGDQAADGRQRRAWPSASSAGCTPISARPATRTNTASSISNAGRSTTWKSAAG